MKRLQLCSPLQLKATQHSASTLWHSMCIMAIYRSWKHLLLLFWSYYQFITNGSNLLSVLCRVWSCISQFWPGILANSHWLSRMMHRYSCVMFWVTLKSFLPSEVRSCNLSNTREQKATIKRPLSYLHTNLHNHYLFWKGSGRILQISGNMNKHKEDSASEVITVYISSE